MHCCPSPHVAFYLIFGNFFLSHICFVDISNLDKSVGSLPRCGVTIVQVHQVLVFGRDWQRLLHAWV